MKYAFVARLAILAGIMLVAALAASPLASARDSIHHQNGIVTSKPAASSESAANYWTPERMARAKPAMPTVTGTARGGAEPTALGSPVDVPGYLPPWTRGDDPSEGPSHATTVARPYTNAPDRMNGKVYFTKATGGDFVCSGTAVNTENKAVVWTAGHCVHAGGGGSFHVVDKWKFVPAFADTCCPATRPYGTWKARTLGTTGEWAANGNLRQDVGMAVLKPLTGKKLVYTVGGQGMRFNSPKQQAYSDFGYPVLSPFDGNSQYRCNSNFLANDFPPGAGPAPMKIHCNMTGGSSGGGWLTSIANGLGYVTSVNSYIRGNQPDRIFGPYQQTAALDLFTTLRKVCAGVATEDVAGPDPTFRSISPLAGFRNNSSACQAVWAPTLDDGFVPQGLALGSSTALVSGYVCDSSQSPFCSAPSGSPYCRIVRVNLTTGALTGKYDFSSGCSHGGGIAIEQPSGRVWLADTGELMRLNPSTLFSGSNPVVQTIHLEAGFHASFLTEDGSSLWIGDFDQAKMFKFPYTTLVQQGTAPLTTSQATSQLAVAAKPQGADFGPSGLWVASSKSTCGRLTKGATTYGFGPGVEEIDFAPDGYLWAVFEAGAKPYPNKFFPLVARFDPKYINDAPDCTP